MGALLEKGAAAGTLLVFFSAALTESRKRVVFHLALLSIIYVQRCTGAVVCSESELHIELDAYTVFILCLPKVCKMLQRVIEDTHLLVKSAYFWHCIWQTRKV